MDREQIKKILPHREPMLLLDTAEVVEGENGPEAHGTYRVTGEEFFVQGHFPGNPWYRRRPVRDARPELLRALGGGRRRGVDPLLHEPRQGALQAPGEARRHGRARLLHHEGAADPFRFATGRVRVGDTVCVTADFSFAIMPAE